MRVCSKCGSPDNGTGVCSNCKSTSFRTIGSQSNNNYVGVPSLYNDSTVPLANNYQQQGYANAAYQKNTYNSGTLVRNQYQNQIINDFDPIYGLPNSMSDAEKMMMNQEVNSANTLGTIALVLGIFGILFLVTVILGAVGISKVNGLPIMPPNSPFEVKKRSAKTKCILGIVIPIVISVLYLVIGLAIVEGLFWF